MCFMKIDVEMKLNYVLMPTCVTKLFRYFTSLCFLRLNWAGHMEIYLLAYCFIWFIKNSTALRGLCSSKPAFFKLISIPFYVHFSFVDPKMIRPGTTGDVLRWKRVIWTKKILNGAFHSCIKLSLFFVWSNITKFTFVFFKIIPIIFVYTLYFF